MRKFLTHSVAMAPMDWAVDAIVAAGAFGFACLQLTFANDLLVPDEFLRRLFGVGAPHSPELALAAVALSTLPLVLRRRYPWPVLALTMLAWMIGQSAAGTTAFSLVGPLVALFTLAYERPRAEAVAAAVAVAVLVAVPTLVSVLGGPPPKPGGGPGRGRDVSAFALIQNLAFVAASAFAGYALHARQDYLMAAEQRAEEAERTREATAQRRVEEERLRIAREVHDITAHSLSAVSIQAAVAERLVDVDPAAAKEAISQVRAVSKQALDEMRAIVGVLRSTDDRMPTQGTDRLGDLVAYLRDAGVEASLEEAGYQRALVPAYMDVALFSIAREAATNIVRHAEATHALIALRTDETDDGQLRAHLVIEDDGRGMPFEGVTGGHGLQGLAERVSLLGGTFAVGAVRPKGEEREAVQTRAGASAASPREADAGHRIDQPGMRIEVSVPLPATAGGERS